jgi:hypothetical protein
LRCRCAQPNRNTRRLPLPFSTLMAASGSGGDLGRAHRPRQVHTPESIALKHEIHALHKRHQASSDEAEKKQLQEAMLAEAKGVPLPKHVLDLPKKVVRPPWWK